MVFTRTERHRAGLKGFSDYNSALNITNAGIIKQEFGKVINSSPRCLSEEFCKYRRYLRGKKLLSTDVYNI